jgi:hypothetical protein
MYELLGIPVAASAHAGEIDRMTVLLHWLMFTLFIGWGLYFVYVLVRFRQGAHPKANSMASEPRGRLHQWAVAGIARTPRRVRDSGLGC